SKWVQLAPVTEAKICRLNEIQGLVVSTSLHELRGHSVSGDAWLQPKRLRMFDEDLENVGWARLHETPRVTRDYPILRMDWIFPVFLDRHINYLQGQNRGR